MAFTLRPAVGKDFVGREMLIKEIINILKNKKVKMGFALYGKRRIGKTSVFKEVQRRLEGEQGIIVAYFSCWELVENSLAEFAESLTAEIIDAYGPILGLKYKAKELIQMPFNILRKTLKELDVGINIGEEVEILLKIGKESKPDFGTLIEKALMLPEKLAKKTNTRCVLLIDEFPSILDLKNGAKIGEGAIRKIRTINETYANTVLCISGSIRKTMELVAISPGSAFYKQFLIKEVKPLEVDEVKQLLKNNLPRREITPEALDALYGFTKGIPFYVQFIGKALSSGKGKIEKEEIEKAAQEFLNQEGTIIFKEEFKNLSPKERKILAAMASAKVSKPAQIAEVLQDKRTNVNTFLLYLEEKGQITKLDKGVWVFEDPLFEQWLAQKYGGE
jgi:AAA+ ATPase superfamily predicted ATPase